MTIADIMALVVTDPLRAAAEMDKLADRLHAMADDLRQGRNPGGISDRVIVNVVGPQGDIKQHVDTGTER